MIRESADTRARVRELVRGNELMYILKIIWFAILNFGNTIRVKELKISEKKNWIKTTLFEKKITFNFLIGNFLFNFSRKKFLAHIVEK